MSDFEAFAEEIDGGMEYLEHHGILGQRWGKLNGPPYPLGSGDHSKRERRLAARAGIKVGGNSKKGSVEKLIGSKSPKKVMTEAEKRQAALDAAMKGDKKKIAKYMDYLSREELNEAENRARIKDNMTRQEPGEKKMSKAEMEKMEAMRSGDKEKVKQFADQMTYAELAEAMNKVNLTTQLNHVDPPPTLTDKINKVMTTVENARRWAETGISAYNTLAKVYNSTHPDSEGWPEINANTKMKQKELAVTEKLANQAKKDVQKAVADKEKSYKEQAKEALERQKTDYEMQKKMQEYVEADRAKDEKKAEKERQKEFSKMESEAYKENAKYDRAKAKEEKKRPKDEAPEVEEDKETTPVKETKLSDYDGPSFSDLFSDSYGDSMRDSWTKAKLKKIEDEESWSDYYEYAMRHSEE